MPKIVNEAAIFDANGNVRQDKLIGIDFPSTDFTSVVDANGNVTSVTINQSLINTLIQTYLTVNGYKPAP